MEILIRPSPKKDLPVVGHRRYGVYPGEGTSPSLPDLVAGFIADQKRSWPALDAGCAALKAVRVREICGDGLAVKVQFNPQRIVSMSEPVDPESIRRRPCFLCPENLPGEQRAILYRGEYLILCNPAPIFPGHLTIVHIRHLPQSLPDHLGIFLRLAEDFGPWMTVFYNGPHCGASAPDHLHFQAVAAGFMPVEEEVRDLRNRARVLRRNGVTICRTEGLGRGALVIVGENEAGVTAAVGEILRELGRMIESAFEPMLNVLCTHTGEFWRLILFPRLKHRPDAYFR
ncbi:MAG: DUF4922 domain-containing protein, partial [Proteobacteria bacterium]|nr:DUF4922 domain-containing protein [Pseudomonadota bacterium]